MSAIQSGSDWWVDSVAQFPGGAIGDGFSGGPVNLTLASALSSNDGSSDSISSVISDIEEEGQAGLMPQTIESPAQPVDLLAESIDTNSTEMGVSEEIVAAAAMRIGVVEAAMRQHQATGVVNFDDDDAESGGDFTAGSYPASLFSDMLQDPSKAFAAITPGQDRPGLLALLGN